MKKILKYSLILTAITFTGCKSPAEEDEIIIPVLSEPVSSLEKIIEKGYLEIATFYNTTDFYIYKGDTRGFHYELAKKFADYLGVRLHVKKILTDIDSAFTYLEKGEVDLVAAGITQTPERESIFAFSDPVYSTKEVLIQNNRNKLISSIEELNGKSIHIQKGSSFQETLLNMEDSLDIHFKIIPDSIGFVEDLLYQVETLNIPYTIADLNLARSLSYMKHLDFSLVLKDKVTASWIMQTDNQELADRLNEWLAEIKKSGYLNILINKYFSSKPDIPIKYSKYALLKKGEISPYDHLIKKAGKELGWDWRLLAALIYTESRFNPEAESPIGAYGLMQVIPETADMFNMNAFYSPDDNIKVGVEFLKYLNKFFESYPIEESEKIKFILASYNIGAGHIRDAMRLAEKYDKDPYTWHGNVDYFLLKKREPEYYKDPLCKNGPTRGTETYNYVYRVMETYNNYKHFE